MILQPQIPVEQQSIQSPGSPLRGLWQKCYCAFSKKPIYCSAGAWVYFVKCFSRKMDQNYFPLWLFFVLCFSSDVWIMTLSLSVYLFIRFTMILILYFISNYVFSMIWCSRSGKEEVPHDTVSGVIQIWVIWVVISFEHSKDTSGSTGSKNTKLVDFLFYIYIFFKQLDQRPEMLFRILLMCMPSVIYLGFWKTLPSTPTFP